MNDFDDHEGFVDYLDDVGVFAAIAFFVGALALICTWLLMV